MLLVCEGGARASGSVNEVNVNMIEDTSGDQQHNYSSSVNVVGAA